MVVLVIAGMLLREALNGTSELISAAYRSRLQFSHAC
jgi:hypothetical protein